VIDIAYTSHISAKQELAPALYATETATMSQYALRFHTFELFPLRNKSHLRI